MRKTLYLLSAYIKILEKTLISDLIMQLEKQGERTNLNLVYGNNKNQRAEINKIETKTIIHK